MKPVRGFGLGRGARGFQFPRALHFRILRPLATLGYLLFFMLRS
jgi:hypothetical protein